jgi:glutamate formiminotransferase
VRTLVECVPNFSEGRDRDKVAKIADAIRSVPDVHVLDVHMDPDHHRSVVTFVGTRQSVLEAAVRAVGEAARQIDLNRHLGEHPRIGAADVVPFVPVEGVTLADCVAIARQAGAEIYRRFRIPVYFYEQAALRPDHRNLADVRRGGYERLREEILSDSSRRPDVGEPRLHPTAGATAVGARPFLIAFNVQLDSSDREAARAIARTIRASGGGLPAVKAMGVLLRSRGRPGEAQVSMNLTDFRQTSPAQAFQAVEREAARLGISVLSSEIVGLVPAKAMEGIAPESLRLAGFAPDKIFENRLASVVPEGRAPGASG